jgi:hypothetical protein
MVAVVFVVLANCELFVAFGLVCQSSFPCEYPNTNQVSQVSVVLYKSLIFVVVGCAYTQVLTSPQLYLNL